MGVLRYQCRPTASYYFLIFRSIMRTNIRIGGNKKPRFYFQFYFDFSLPNSNKPINNKKGIIRIYSN